MGYIIEVIIIIIILIIIIKAFSHLCPKRWKTKSEPNPPEPQQDPTMPYFHVFNMIVYFRHQMRQWTTWNSSIRWLIKLVFAQALVCRIPTSFENVLTSNSFMIRCRLVTNLGNFGLSLVSLKNPFLILFYFLLSTFPPLKDLSLFLSYFYHVANHVGVMIKSFTLVVNVSDAALFLFCYFYHSEIKKNKNSCLLSKIYLCIFLSFLLRSLYFFPIFSLIWFPLSERSHSFN